MKKILLFIALLFVFSLFAETVWDGEDVETDSTTYQLMKNIKLVDVDRLSVILTNNGDSSSYYELRFYSNSGYDGDYAYQGRAYADGDSLCDSLATFVVDGTLIGQTIYNLTDGSSGTITEVDTTIVEADLAGGTNNSWEEYDIYKITRPSSYYALGSTTLASGSQATYELDSYYSRMCLYLKKTASADSTAEFRVDYSLNIRR